MRRFTIAAAAVLLSGCYTYPYYPYYPYYGYAATTTTVASPPSFDKSWDAALGAAADAGVQVTQADRSTGRISGVKAGAPVTIDLRPQANNTLQVVFNAPGSTESGPTLNERWLAAYERRMGR
ncbi:hypothetical protein WG902_03785 [Ramlibacter sp. PS3R-8]|uniref:hypothetical protein n=1 Tax=Ramlibacter sp. PS3R-8 TaxID=3133437 RepID=UPI0030982266